MTLTARQRRDLLKELSTTFPGLEFDPQAFDVFLNAEDHGGWRGKSAAGWLKSVNQRGEIVPEAAGKFCQSELDRLRLHQYCRRSGVSDLESFVAVMAWGGMSVKTAFLLRLLRLRPRIGTLRGDDVGARLVPPN